MTAVSPFTLNLLGNLQLLQTTTGQAIALRRKSRALLAYLAANPPQTRQTLMTVFCTEAKAPNRTLNILLSRIRQATTSDIILDEQDHLTLNLTRLASDLSAFLDILGGDVAKINLSQLETAVSLYRAPFLDGFILDDTPHFDMWVLHQRAQLQSIYEQGLLTLIRRQRQALNFVAAQQHAQTLVASNPLLEEAHAQLIWLYARTGQRAAAQAQYTQCCTLLQTELGVLPTAELQTLHTGIESGSLHWPWPTRKQTAVSPSTLPSSASFIGRQTEFEQLHTLWGQAQAGQGSILLIGGPAGSGKTRLVEELATHIPATMLYRATCSESTKTLPYQPWLTILEAHCHQQETAVWAQLPPTTQSYLSRLLPIMTPHLPQASTTASGMDTPEYLFTAVVDLLAHPMADQQPRLFFLDDLHWADETSLRLLAYIAHRINQFPWLLIGTYRSEETAEFSILNTLLDDLARLKQTRLQLKPLQLEDLRILTTQLWPTLPHEAYAHFAPQLMHATGGNALFATAVLQELSTSDQIPSDLPLPSTVHALLQRRLRHLSAGIRQVLEALAVWNQPATTLQLQQVSAQSDETITEAMDWGLRMGLIAANTAVIPTTYQFQHGLMRLAVSATSSAIRQQRLHQRTAIWLTHVAQRTPSKQQEMAGRILYHAQQGEAFDLVFEWAAIVAEQTRQIFVYDEAARAIDAMRFAFAQLQFDPDFDLDAAEKILFEELLWWLFHRWMLGIEEETETAVLHQTRELFTHHPTPLRHAKLQFIEACFLDYGASLSLLRDVHHQFVQLQERSLAAMAMIETASILTTQSRNREGRQAYEIALNHYQQLEDGSGIIRSLGGLAWTAANLGEVAKAFHYSQQALSISQADGDKLGEAQALFGLAVAWTFYHVPQQMAHFAQASQQLYLEMGFTLRAIRPYLYLGAAYDMGGDWQTGLRIYEEILAHAQASSDRWITGWAAQLSGRIYLRQGQLTKAEECLQLARQIRLATGEQQNQVSDLAWLARLALAQNDNALADTLSAEAMALLAAFASEFYVWEQPDVLMSRAEVLSRMGHKQDALAVAQEAQATLHRFAAQIEDATVRQTYYCYWLNERIKTAVSQQKIPSQFPSV